MKTKTLNLTVFAQCVGQTSIEVPADLTIEQAIAYAREHLAEVSVPVALDYVKDTLTIDEENCDFED